MGLLAQAYSIINYCTRIVTPNAVKRGSLRAASTQRAKQHRLISRGQTGNALDEQDHSYGLMYHALPQLVTK